MSTIPDSSLQRSWQRCVAGCTGLRNSWKIANFAVSKDGCFERAGTVKIGGVNPAKSGFVDLKRNLLTIKYML